MTAITLDLAFAVLRLSRTDGRQGRRRAVAEPAAAMSEPVPMLSDFASSRVASATWFRTHRPIRPT